ncbi:MAG: VCBS repeat-containing protein [Thiohalocapsa sp.]
MRIPGDRRPRYLMSSEGEGQLRTLEATEDGGLKVIAQVAVPFPRFSAPFQWPDWPSSVAVASFSPAAVILVKGLDPALGTIERGGALLPLRGTVNPLTTLTVADVEGDGVDEVLFATLATGQLWRIRYPGPDARPAVEALWESPSLGAVRHVLASDINRDGKLDLIAPAEAASVLNGEVAAINLLINRGGADFEQFELAFRTPPAVEGGMAGVRAIGAGRDQDDRFYILASGYNQLTLYRLPDDGRPDAAESKTLRHGNYEPASQLVLRDVDNDGWLDAVLARLVSEQSGLVIFGPLWENFDRAEAKPLEGVSTQ